MNTSANVPSVEPLTEGHVRMEFYMTGEPRGIRDRTGFLCFFNQVQRYDGQQERYRQELALRRRQADVMLAALVEGSR